MPDEPNIKDTSLPPHELGGTSESPLLALRQQTMQRLGNSLRPGQQAMADWHSGALAVSAVPGAGKSTGMAVAAALAIARNQLHARRQLVIVTFTRSAAANIRTKVRQYLRELSIPPSGFIVNTLHGLALNIARRHQDLSGLNLETATVVSPNQNHRLIRACVEQWIAANPQRYSTLLEGNQFDGEETERLRRQSVLRTEVLPQLAITAITEAKSSGLSPQKLWELSQYDRDGYQILALAAGLYEQYQKYAIAHNLIDYDDMILAALRVLENDTARRLWQEQVFAVFEDEAQDSSPLQYSLLQILAADALNPHAPLNLVRVGDPNQAINSTFTPADRIYFDRFCNECAALGRLAKMDRAGRSTKIIIDAANFVLEWVNSVYCKNADAAHLPFTYQSIKPVNPGDPQPNPEAVGMGLEIYTPPDIYHTARLIKERAIALFAQNPESNAAVLVRENRQAEFVAKQLEDLHRQHNIKVYDVSGRSSHSHVPREILALLQFLDRPHSPDYLKTALVALVQRHLIATQDLNALATYPEQFLYPGPLEPPQTLPVREASRFCHSLLRARLQLPHYQLIPFLALTLNYDQTELATAHKLAARIAQQTSGNTSMRSIIEVLGEIIKSEKFDPVEVSEENNSQQEHPYTRAGQLTIITMHKAKGLDWDHVFIPFLHQDTIPGSPWVPTAAQFLGDFTLAEVARAQIRAHIHGNYTTPRATDAWKQAGHLKSAEEFRLLYVAMTRAKRLLWMAAAQKGPFRWNTFSDRNSDNLQDKKPCPVIPVLKSRFPQSVVSLSVSPK